MRILGEFADGEGLNRSVLQLLCKMLTQLKSCDSCARKAAGDHGCRTQTRRAALRFCDTTFRPATVPVKNTYPNPGAYTSPCFFTPVLSSHNQLSIFVWGVSRTFRPKILNFSFGHFSSVHFATCNQTSQNHVYRSQRLLVTPCIQSDARQQITHEDRSQPYSVSGKDLANCLREADRSTC